MASNEIIEYKESTVLECFSDKDGIQPLIESVKTAVNSFEHDMSTSTSRAKTASLSGKVSKFKVKIDSLGKDLVADWKSKSKAVDANRKAMRDAMDDLRDEARKPLDEWEAEQATIAADAAAKVEAEKLAIKIESDHEIAVLLDREHDRLIKEAAEEQARIALEAKEKADRELKEREALIAKEAAAKVLKQEEVKRIAAENKALRDAQEAATREANAKAALVRAEEDRIAAEEKAKQDAIDAVERQKAAVKAAEEKAAADKQQAIDDERERVRIDAEEQRLRQEEAAKAVAKKQDNRNHRAKIHKTVKEFFIKSGISESLSVEIVKKLSKGELEELTINY